MPIVFDPGSTSSPSSETTITPGLIENFAVLAGFSLLETAEPIPPSDEPIASIKVMSACSNKPSFTSALHITPLDMMLLKEDKS